MKKINKLWMEYNNIANKLTKKIGATNNIIGEYAEYLALQYLGGKKTSISSKAVDIIGKNNKKYQVKARKLNDDFISSQLGIIRSWDFDCLIVILFKKDGTIMHAFEISKKIAQSYAAENAYQNGTVITINRKLLDNNKVIKITKKLNKIINRK